MHLSIRALQIMKFALAEPEREFSGAEVARATGIGSGTLYPLLIKFEDQGWMKSRWEKIDPSEVKRPRRRIYKLTGLGYHFVRAELRKVSHADTSETLSGINGAGWPGGGGEKWA